MNTILDNTKFDDVSYFDSEVELSSVEVLRVTDNLLKRTSSLSFVGQQGVCVLMERGARYIAVMMAAWSAGLYVVPLNTAWPLHKNKDIISRIKPFAVIADTKYSEDLENEFNVINSLDLFDSTLNFVKPGLSVNPLRPADIAYIIFTSGSTGEPKGVVISAASFRSYIEWTRRYFSEYSGSKRLLLTSELTFDITMGDIAFALAFGASIGVARQNTNIPSVLAMIMKYKIDVLYSVPTTHLALASFSKRKRGADLTSIKLILSGGDRFPWQLVNDYKKLTQGAHFYNVYGPTETTINCFSLRLDNKDHLSVSDKPVPIGECFDSLDFALLNENGELCSEGELCISGPQLMLGYFNDSMLTSSAFTKDPTVDFINRPLYKTGDLAYVDNGLIYLKGRIDGLVKIKGYRIHPDEVSKAIDTLQGISVSSVVTVGEQSEATLTAFIKQDQSNSWTKNSIALVLKDKLPAYMIPSDFIFLDSFPLNQSGKIDKKALIKEFL